MALETMDVCSLESITRRLRVVDKYNLAATCTQVRSTLCVLFAAWDLALADEIAASVEANQTTGTFAMRRYEAERSVPWAVPWTWPTSKMCEPPAMVFEYEGGGCHAYEHVFMRNVEVTYCLKPMRDPTVDKVHGDKPVFRARPVITGASYGKVNTLTGIPTKAVSWEVRPEARPPGTLYLEGDPVVGDEAVVYTREYNVVHADVRTVNPRVRLELMGDSVFARQNYVDAAGDRAGPRAPNPKVANGRAHINMQQLRLYIQKPTMTPAMRARAQRHAFAWQCDRCTLLNARAAAKCVACKTGKRPPGIVQRRR